MGASSELVLLVQLKYQGLRSYHSMIKSRTITWKDCKRWLPDSYIHRFDCNNRPVVATQCHMSPNYSTTNKLMYYLCENVLRHHFSHCKAPSARYSNVHMNNSTVTFFVIYNRCMFMSKLIGF